MESNKIVTKHPTLFLDKKKCLANIRRMKTRADNLGVKFRPHFKTHQSATVAKWIRQAGVQQCTVSSIEMAQYFAGHGWHDIIIAFPVNIRAVDDINELASNVKLQLLISDLEAVRRLEDQMNFDVGARIEIDTGQGRTGFKTDDYEGIEAVMDALDAAGKLDFRGFYSHPGHTYTAGSPEEVREMYRAVTAKVAVLDERYRSRYPDMEITCGDTPGCSLADAFAPISEITPGNFVFYDLMQLNIGACSVDDIAVAVACPVVGKNAGAGEVVIHGGAVHFSKDRQEQNGLSHFGLIAKTTNEGWGDIVPDTRLAKISQEHGIIHSTNEAWLEDLSVGDMVYILPVHSCLTADVMRRYRLTDGDWISGPAGFMP